MMANINKPLLGHFGGAFDGISCADYHDILSYFIECNQCQSVILHRKYIGRREAFNLKEEIKSGKM